MHLRIGNRSASHLQLVLCVGQHNLPNILRCTLRTEIVQIYCLCFLSCSWNICQSLFRLHSIKSVLRKVLARPCLTSALWGNQKNEYFCVKFEHLRNHRETTVNAPFFFSFYSRLSLFRFIVTRLVFKRLENKKVSFKGISGDDERRTFNYICTTPSSSLLLAAFF